MADGPRALRQDEWAQLNQVESEVFRPEMFQDYPQLFNERNRANLRVVADDGKVVCHVGFIERGASLAGCRIDVCCIGAVATLAGYRGKGYASLAFQDACDKSAADGVDVMLISGGRGLYTRVGCRQVGQEWDYSLTADESARLAPSGFAVQPVGAARIDALAALYQGESVRFLRPREDWERAFSCGIVMNTPSDFWGVTRSGALVAYVIVHQPNVTRARRPNQPFTARVVELAGDRAAIASALPALLTHYGTERVSVHVQAHDRALHAILAAAGLDGQPGGSSGTIRVINFPQLMNRCRSYLAERIGSVAEELSFTSDERPGSALGGYVVRHGSDYARVSDHASLAVLLFGSPDRQEQVALEGSARVATLLRKALPLPSLWYGISYV